RHSVPLLTHFSLYLSAPPRDLHSFPTRRSSDLPVADHGVGAGHCLQIEAACVSLIGDCGSGEAVGQHHRAPRNRRANHFGEVLRSEEHTSELQSLTNLVCRLLLEKKKTNRAEPY